MNKWFSIIFILTMLLLGHISESYAQERRNDSTSTFLQSQAAIVRLGVWDKFGKPRNYTATFVVTAPNGKQNKAQKAVAADDVWVYVDFPNEFTGDVPDYSTFTTYKWKCLVGGKEVATGQFQWGGSRASTDSNSTSVVENTPAKAPATISIEDHQIVFDLQKCVKSGSSIICDFSLTNKGDDRWFVWVTEESKVYDELGNGYMGASGKLAKESGGSVRIGFISGVTTQAQMTFNGIEPLARKITVLRIHFDVGDNVALDIKMRNVPLVVSK